MNHQLPHAWIKYVGISYLSLYKHSFHIREKVFFCTAFQKKIIIVLNNLNIFHILSKPLSSYKLRNLTDFDGRRISIPTLDTCGKLKTLNGRLRGVQKMNSRIWIF